MSQRVEAMQVVANDPIDDPILEQVESGRDVRIEGGASAARLDAVAAGLEATCNVVRLTAPSGGLSLSALIAQLSGRGKFDEQDDGALEAGFRRLSGADAPDRPTVVILDARHGLQRPVLRYLQQVGHNAPRLRFVIASSPELAGMLDAPDMARLRSRLEHVVVADDGLAEADDGLAAAAVEPGQAPVPVPPAAALKVALPSDWTVEAHQRTAVRKRRRTRRVALMWTTSAAALAASVAVGAWLGQARTAERMAARNTAAMPERRVELTLPVVPAHVAAPTLAEKAPPLPARADPVVPLQTASVVRPVKAGPGTPALVPVPELAKLSAPDLVAAGAPTAAVPAKPETASAEERLVTSPVRPRAVEAHRAAPPARPRAIARERAPAESSRYAEDERPIPDYGIMDLPPDVPPRGRVRGRMAREPIGRGYDSYAREFSRPYDGPNPGGARYEQSGDGPYIGTFSTGPYGARVFRYGP